MLVDASGYVRTDTARYRRYYHIDLASADPGKSGATWQANDANQMEGWQLDAATEFVSGTADIHADWDGASDIMLDVDWSINVAGANPGDEVDYQVIVYMKGAGDTATKSQTITGSVTIDAAAQYTAFTTEVAIDHDSGTDPVDVGDVISFELYCLGTGEVTSVRVTNLSMYYNTTHTGIESGDT